jgi:hypothetical protein
MVVIEAGIVVINFDQRPIFIGCLDARARSRAMYLISASAWTAGMEALTENYVLGSKPMKRAAP